MKSFIIIQIINGILSSFVVLTNGSLFTTNVKGIFNIISIIVDIGLTILTVIKYGIGSGIIVFLSFFITARVFAYIFKKTIFKNINI